MFFMVKAVAMVTSKLHKEEEKPAAPAGPTTEELLAEIRDLLKEKNAWSGPAYYEGLFE